MCGAGSLVAIARWIARADRRLLERLGLQAGSAWTAPADTTLGRAFRGLDADALDDALGQWIAQITGLGGALAVDGKAMRGAAKAGAAQPHLVAAVDQQDGAVLAQRAVDEKSNEITAFVPLLDGLDLQGRIVTADALHCQRGHADFLHSRGAFYLFPVKGNQPNLFTALDALPWTTTPVAHRTGEHSRGRHEIRELKVLPATKAIRELFPQAAQALLIERTTTGRGDGLPHRIAELAVTSAPWHLAPPPILAACARGHWSIEAIHHIRDVTYREDASRTRTGQTPRAMAAFRNTAISLAHLIGWDNITAASEHYQANPDDALSLLAIPTPDITQRDQIRLAS
jgi:predicted transposase YbfD/YdcC